MNHFDNDIEQCLAVLASGGNILYPTDTVWGLGCDATNEQAVNKLINLKEKPAQKGLIILLPTERDVLQYVANPDMEVFDYLAQQTKPVTVIYKDGLGVADPVLNADGSIAIRLVNEDFCRHLLKRFKKPIVSTSANFHGHPSPVFFRDIDPELINRVDYTAHYRRNDTNSTAASSIIKWNGNGDFTVIRK